jgi:hypothetical protein
MTTVEDTQRHICSLCGVPFNGWGNNPAPLGEVSERCCDDCNARFVLPARLGLLTAHQVNALQILMDTWSNYATAEHTDEPA